MLNPLIHNSNSAPTSPMLTRSIHTKPASHSGNGGGNTRVILRQTQSILNSGRPRTPRPASPARSRDSRDLSPVNIRLKIHPGGGNGSGGPQPYRRLSRLVKCRTLDFTEFPEGMREYTNKYVYNGHHQVSRQPQPQMSQYTQQMVMRAGFHPLHPHHKRPPQHGVKMLVRESKSQPGSPVSIPKIKVQDFGGIFTGSEVGSARYLTISDPL